MDIVIKLVTVVAGVVTVVALFGVLLGWNKFTKGKKSDNDQLMDNGIEAMVMGGITAVITPGIAAGIIAALSKISF